MGVRVKGFWNSCWIVNIPFVHNYSNYISYYQQYMGWNLPCNLIEKCVKDFKSHLANLANIGNMAGLYKWTNSYRACNLNLHGENVVSAYSWEVFDLPRFTIWKTVELALNACVLLFSGRFDFRKCRISAFIRSLTLPPFDRDGR